MNTLPLPTIIHARLKVAAKIKGRFKRMEEINNILEEAKLYFPQCFRETYNNKPQPYVKSKFEKYIDNLSPKHHIFLVGD